MGSMRWLTEHGDERLEWDPDKPEEVEEARSKFEELKTRGYLLYEMVEETVRKRGRRIHEFSPDLGAVIAAPQMAGG